MFYNNFDPCALLSFLYTLFRDIGTLFENFDVYY